MSKMKLLLDVVEDLRSLAGSLETLASAADMTADVDADEGTTLAIPMQPPTTTDTQTSGESKLTIVELRAFVAQRSTPENRPRIKAILSAHGVNKLTELPDDQYEAVMREVDAL